MVSIWVVPVRRMLPPFTYVKASRACDLMRRRCERWRTARRNCRAQTLRRQGAAIPMTCGTYSVTLCPFIDGPMDAASINRRLHTPPAAHRLGNRAAPISISIGTRPSATRYSTRTMCLRSIEKISDALNNDTIRSQIAEAISTSSSIPTTINSRRFCDDASKTRTPAGP
jgi:hypothetical protein